MEQKQATQRYYYNQGARELKPLASGEQVHVQTKSGNWKPATVLSQHSTLRSYIVPTSNGSKYCRNRCHLLTTRSLCAKENRGGQCDKPETSTTTLEGHENIEDAKSGVMLNQKPTAYPQTQDPYNEPYVTRSGRVVKPPVRLDLRTNSEKHSKAQLVVSTVYSIHSVRREM